ncbi:hypothetical protein F4815DRAFT_312959 [Daldinia loculata]|nr:hypothetical protein F4815DRAFT_312959 [Daldinia loculata]
MNERRWVWGFFPVPRPEVWLPIVFSVQQSTAYVLPKTQIRSPGFADMYAHPVGFRTMYVCPVFRNGILCINHATESKNDWSLSFKTIAYMY